MYKINPTINTSIRILLSPAIAMKLRKPKNESSHKTKMTAAICLNGLGRIPIIQTIKRKTNKSNKVSVLEKMVKRLILTTWSAGIFIKPKSHKTTKIITRKVNILKI